MVCCRIFLAGILPFLREKEFSVERIPKWQEEQEKVAGELGSAMNFTPLETASMSLYFVQRIWRNSLENFFVDLNLEEEFPVERGMDAVLDETFRANYFVGAENEAQYFAWLKGMKNVGRTLGSYFYRPELAIGLVRNIMVSGSNGVKSNRIDPGLSIVPRVRLSQPISIAWRDI